MLTFKRKNTENDFEISAQISADDLFSSTCNRGVDERMLDTLLNIDELNGTGVSNEKKGQRFEWFLYDLFKHAGYDVEKVSREGAADDKIDLIIQRGNEKIAIQAKNYKLDGTYSVDKDVAMSFSGAIENRKDITAGAIITTNFFTYPARKWQEQIESKPIYFIDREKLFVLIASLWPQLLAKAYFEQDTKEIHRCKLCGSITIKKRSGKNNNSYFRGCINYPKCEYTEKIPKQKTENETGYEKSSYGSKRFSSKYNKYE